MQEALCASLFIRGGLMEEIYHRVSVRKFLDKEVKDEDIIQILKAGMQAPSACNQQPWEFYVVKDRKIIEELSNATPYASPCKGANVVIVPIYKTENLMAPMYAPIDLSIALENMWLETDSLGLGGVWIGVCPQADRMKKVGDILGLPLNLKAFALFPIGYPAETRKQQDRFDKTRIHYV